MKIRQAVIQDCSRIAEIFIFNNRIYNYPIFKDASFSFGELQVISFAEHYLKQEEIFKQLYVYDDGLIRGFMQINQSEIIKLYVDPFFQSQGIGHQLIEYAIHQLHTDTLWALEKNKRALSFYEKHGFHPTGLKKLEEDTTEYLVQLKR